ncbi:proton-activated chloride channel [Gastrophryne carolinensis]
MRQNRDELSEEVEHQQEDEEIPEDMEEPEDKQEDLTSVPETDRSSPPVRFSRTCLKNFFSVLLIFVYLLLMGVAVFLVYQTITDFQQKLKHPVMSVSYKEVDVYEAPVTITLVQRILEVAVVMVKVILHFSFGPNKTRFMQDCESSFSSWKFSGGFRTWVKMSLVKTTEEDGSQSVEFRQETSVVNYIDRRPAVDKGDQLFFVVFEWKDPYIQEVQDIITANPWSMIALLCGVFLVLFKAADFAKLSVKWMIKIRKRHLKKRARELNHIS